MMYNLTIIIPHYNAADKLGRLLNSIPNRDDLQVIVVDDHSDFDLREKLSTDQLEMIQLIDNQTSKKGAGVCRNFGLCQARGKWILFADADDCFIEGFFDIVCEFFDTDYDVVFFLSTSVDESTGEPSTRHLHAESQIKNYLNLNDTNSELFLRYKLLGPVAKLIRRDFIEQHALQFDEVIASNDVMFSTKVGHYMQNFFVSEQVIYCITRGKGNLTLKHNQEVFDARLRVFINRYHFLVDNLSKEEFQQLHISGFYIIHFAIIYGLGFKKVIETYKILRKNDIKLLTFRDLGLLFQIKKVSNYFKRKKELRQQSRKTP